MEKVIFSHNCVLKCCSLLCGGEEGERNGEREGERMEDEREVEGYQPSR